MPTQETRAIEALDNYLATSSSPWLVKAGPMLWNALRYSGRVQHGSDRISLLKLDRQINVILDGFQEDWGFTTHE